MSGREVVIRTRGLTKRYRGRRAVDGLDLDVAGGEVFGVLGPNGSGKTTTLLMLLGLTDPSAGEIAVLGMDPRRAPISVKRQVGYLPDSVGFYDELTGRENLRYTARLGGMPRTEAEPGIVGVLERMGLGEVIDARVGTYSRGMRQRLGLAEILLKRPRIAILDEPTLGLDPEGAREFLGIVRGLKDEGMTLVLSSHLLHQVQAVCDRVGLFARGRMVLSGSVETLASQVLGASCHVHLEATGADPRGSLARVPGVRGVEDAGDGEWHVRAEVDVRPALLRAAIEAGCEVRGVTLERPSLDEVYARYFEEHGHEA